MKNHILRNFKAVCEGFASIIQTNAVCRSEIEIQVLLPSTICYMKSFQTPLQMPSGLYSQTFL